ncbi:uncharacterized protein LOC136036058 isoform X4 [Artemia franciscana]|uniref:uncharacterized protein LOC136036058 isoform X4 n=1 Tax=Artemia franciscana TaxID=6661 RepID=UPI0032D9B971
MKVTSGIFVYYCAVFVSSQKFLNRHPFGAGKTQADFDCPEEFGYYPHETDCTQYYVCVFGSALQENCLGGLVYSRELQTCDWPRNADCITNSSSTGHLDDHKFSTIRVVDTRTHSTSPRSIPTQEARIRNGVIRPGQEELETGFSPSPIEIDNRLQRGGARKIESAAGIQEVNNAFEAKTNEDRNNRHRFENQQPVNVPAFSKRPESQDFSTITDSSRFAPPRSESNRFEPPRPDSSRFGPPRPDSGRFDPPRTESSRFDLVRPNSNRFEPSRPSNNEENRFVNRPEKNFEFQPRPDFPVTTPRSLLQPSSTFDSREVEYEYEYVYDELGNPVFEEEEESGEVSSPPVIRTTERTTTEKTTTTTTTTTTTPPRIERIKTTTEAQQFATTSKVSRAKLRGSMKFSETSAASSGTRSEAKQAKSSKGSKKSRPTLKPVGDLVPRRSEPIDISQFPPWRFSSQFETPEPDTPAKKCKPDVCRLPDCYCGGKGVPDDLAAEEVPQIVLLTFDDSVNDLNKELYKDLFEKGRKNPNGCPIQATFYVSHEWTDYSQVQNLYSNGHEIASHTVSHSFGEQFSTKKWAKETAGQRDILAAYAGVKPEDIRGMRAPFLSIGGNKMFKMLYDLNFTYDSSMPVYENKPPSYPYTLDYKLFHDCMIPPCPTKSYPGVWEVPMVMWQDLNGGRCSMGDGCSNPPDAEGVYKMLVKNFERHYTSNRAPFPLYYHAAWFTTPHHKEGFEAFLDTLVSMDDVWVITNWQLIQWMRDPTPLSQIHSFEPFQCSYPERPKPCNNPKVCNLWHKSGVRYMKTCQPCPDFYPWTGKTAVKNSVLERYLADES